jgi:hypothetical protein
MSLITCPECTKQVSSFAPHCPGCGCPIKASGETISNAPPSIIIQDVQMEFGSMAVFMIKWVLAAIPAALIILAAVWIGLASFGIFTR